MDPLTLQILFISAILLVTGALWLAHYVLQDNRRKWPADAFQWSAVALASLVGGLAALLGIMVLAFAANPVQYQSGEMADVRSDELDAQVADFSFRLVSDGSEMRFSDLSGKVVLVNIWATWCPPCLYEMPELNRLQEDYAAAGLVVLNLSDEAREDLLKYQAELPLSTLSAFVDPSSVPEPLQRNFAVRPTSFIIDRGGVLRHSVLGARDYHAFESMILPHLDAGVVADVG